VRRRVEHRLVEPPVLRPAGMVVADVPLAELAGPVAAGAKDVAKGRDAATQERASAGDVHGPVAEAVDARKQLAPRGRAHRGDVEVGQTHALGVQRVEVRRLQDRVAVTGEVAVPLVVGDDDDDVRATARGLGRPGVRRPRRPPEGQGRRRHAQAFQETAPIQASRIMAIHSLALRARCAAQPSRSATLPLSGKAQSAWPARGPGCPSLIFRPPYSTSPCVPCLPRSALLRLTTLTVCADRLRNGRRPRREALVTPLRRASRAPLPPRSQRSIPATLVTGSVSTRM